jgi:hypothetical protein
MYLAGTQTCIKRSSLGEKKNGLVSQVTYEFFMTGQEKVDFVMQVTA